MMVLAAEVCVHHLFCQPLSGSSVLDSSGYRLNDRPGLRLGLTQSLGTV